MSDSRDSRDSRDSKKRPCKCSLNDDELQMLAKLKRIYAKYFEDNRDVSDLLDNINPSTYNSSVPKIIALADKIQAKTPKGVIFRVKIGLGDGTVAGPGVIK